MDLGRWTPLVAVAPTRYADPGAIPEDFDLLEWVETFEWRQDGWNGYRDVLTPPAETIERGRGDCEDFALVAASWALAEGRDGVGVAFCFPPRSPVPRHVVAYDDEWVYDAGRVHTTSLADWLDGSRYVRTVRRSMG